MADEVNRRDFLKAAAIAAGPAVISARGANDKINVGWIGVGTRGNAGIDWLHTAAAQRRADHGRSATPTRATSRAPRTACKTIWGNTPDTYKDYQRAARREGHRRGLHHDAGAPASRYGDRGAQGRQARLRGEAAGPYHRRGLGHHQGVGEVREDLPGRHAEPQLIALQEGARNSSSRA